MRSRLEQHSFRINDRKSQIKQTEVSFLGFKLCNGALLPHPDRLRAFLDLKVPTDKS